MESNYMNLFLFLVTMPNCNGWWQTHTSCIELHFLTHVHFIPITFCPSSFLPFLAFIYNEFHFGTSNFSLHSIFINTCIDNGRMSSLLKLPLPMTFLQTLPFKFFELHQLKAIEAYHVQRQHEQSIFINHIKWIINIP
jgi:hypothetical protein